MKPEVEQALAILDAGKTVRIAEQDLLCVPAKPPTWTESAPPSDPAKRAEWEQKRALRLAEHEKAVRKWEREKEQAEVKLETAAAIYILHLQSALDLYMRELIEVTLQKRERAT